MLKEQDLLLRPLKKDDHLLFYKWRNNISFIKNTKSFRLPKHEGLEEEWLNSIVLDKSNTIVVYVINQEGKDIGFIQLTNIDWISRNCYLGVAICEKKYRAKGFAGRSLKLILDYAFFELNLHKVEAEILNFNEGSIKLFESKGFKKEGTLVGHYFWEKEYHDIHLYGLLKKNYQ